MDNNATVRLSYLCEFGEHGLCDESERYCECTCHANSAFTKGRIYDKSAPISGGNLMATVRVYCGYTPISGQGYLSGFRVIIREAFEDMYTGERSDMDTTLGGIICATPDEALKVAESSANAYLTLLVAFGVITAEAMANSWFEAISPN